jgi:trans-aconitate methyltransferase
MPPAKTWNPELYEGKHSFVWKLGEGALELLDPKPGERILDLGCGTGHLTHRIAKAGASVVGLDASADMIGQARQNFPQITFVLADAARLGFDGEFDAIFSNAALHWMTDAAAVVSGMARALRVGGRLAAEFGAKRNIQCITNAIDEVLPRYLAGGMPEPRTWYPSISEYSKLLEERGFEVRLARVFERPTPLEGESGMENWLHQFKSYYFEDLPPEARRRAIAEVIERLRPDLYTKEGWVADYRRLQVVAVRGIVRAELGTSRRISTRQA